MTPTGGCPARRSAASDQTATFSEREPRGSVSAATRVSDLAAARQPLHALCVRQSGWSREQPAAPFERYADDVVIHCDTEAKAQSLWTALR